MATAKSKGFAMGIIQVALGIISLIVGLATISKESAPFIQKMQEQHHQNQIIQRANAQANMNIQYYYRGNDATYRYYSDINGHYWKRENIQGFIEYAQNPSVVR